DLQHALFVVDPRELVGARLGRRILGADPEARLLYASALPDAADRVSTRDAEAMLARNAERMLQHLERAAPEVSHARGGGLENLGTRERLAKQLAQALGKPELGSEGSEVIELLEQHGMRDGERLDA